MEAIGKLTNMQLELLKLFKYDLPENQLVDIKNILASYFAETASNEIDKLWDENGWDNHTMDNWKGEHLRKRIFRKLRL